MQKISIQQVKQALQNPEFRRSLPEILKEGIIKYEQNPGCPCNVPFYRDVLKYGVRQLKEHFPGMGDVVNPDLEFPKLTENNWSVISCHINDLEKKLKELPNGRKQIAITRWEDQVTVVVNELDLF